MNSMNELINIAKEHGGIIETKTAAERGVSKNMLYKLCKENNLFEISGEDINSSRQKFAGMIFSGTLFNKIASLFLS